MDGYYHTKESVNEYIELAKDVSGEKHIELLRQFLPSNSSLLEIGSGPETDCNILNNHFKVTGSDNSEEFLCHLRSRYSDGRFLKLDAVTLPCDEKFDGIYSNKVLIHLTESELKDSIVRQKELLHPHGVICHSFWKGEGDEIYKGLFVNYQVKDTLKALFEKEFEIVYLETYDEFEENDSLLLIAKRR